MGGGSWGPFLSQLLDVIVRNGKEDSKTCCKSLRILGTITTNFPEVHIEVTKCDQRLYLAQCHISPEMGHYSEISIDRRKQKKGTNRS